jgi:hypothetical protein
MPDLSPPRLHSLHIPVMGTGFTIDAPLRVARYGISSVISMVDDVLIEQMRKFHAQREGEPYEPIPNADPDARALRITAYLDLLGRIVQRQTEAVRTSPFTPDSEITKYFELLPAESVGRGLYDEMLSAPDEAKPELQRRLRLLVVPGRIDINIMSAADRREFASGGEVPLEQSDASAALRGFANSRWASSVVFSAGMNPRLYGYISRFDGFFPDADGITRKQIILKVSDYRSAVIQGKFLAKRGLWVAEYRIESGLNCGGHAFPTGGQLMGPILEEFKRSRASLHAELLPLYAAALTKAGRDASRQPLPSRITAQGGIGTPDENRFLTEHYKLDGTGWATPFLLVPEVTNVDDENLKKLVAATGDDVWLSESSPFMHPFWNLRNSTSEETRRRRIEEGRPGAVCTKGYSKLFNKEFTATPICVASREYQRLKLQSLGEACSDADREKVLVKSCICHDLAGGATRKNGIDSDATPAVCPGPGIADFHKIVTLREMIDHIYGRRLLPMAPGRPHMFLRELRIYIQWLVNKLSDPATDEAREHSRRFHGFLLEGIAYYRRFAEQLAPEARQAFLAELDRQEAVLASEFTPSRSPA